MFRGKRYWVIGASEGLGRALAQELAHLGATLILSARNEDRLKELAEKISGADVVGMDVCDEAAVSEAAKRVGQLDGIIYCAGAYEPMKAQNWDTQKINMMLDVNFSGVIRVLGQVLPTFVEKDAGHIVLIGSLAAYRGLPASTGYGTSKAALMHLGESLYADLRNTGVSVQVVNPGFIQTRLTDKNEFRMPAIQTQQEAAMSVIAAMQRKKPVSSFPFLFSLFFRVGRFLPAGLFYRFMRR
ncbi:MAG: SDR family NAD(P)-dependent oxidoreductase [Pseudoruegeria sp.]